MASRLSIKTLEISGLVGVITAMHLPFGKDPEFIPRWRMRVTPFEECEYIPTRITFETETSVEISKKQLGLLSRLVKSGDQHAKCIRGIHVGVLISAPIWFYRELETYNIGRNRLSSESTMHIECKKLAGEELMKAKDEIPMGHIQRTVDTISYQTLRRIYFQRRNHRLPLWHEFCSWIESLPLAKELITIEKDEKE